MPIRSVTLRILGDSKDALTKMKAVNAEADKLEKRKVNVRIGVDIDNNDIVAVKAKIAALSKLSASIQVKLDTKGLLADFAKIKEELAALRQMARDLNITPNVDIAKMAQANAVLTGMALAANKAAHGVTTVAADTQKANTIMGNIFRNRGGGFGLFNTIFGGKFLLFGGLATIGTLHLLVDAIAEVLAVVVPAGLALGAFGIAAGDAAKHVITHMSNLHTVMEATGRTIPPMTNAMEKLHQAVQPAVYQIFGDALTIMNAKTGIFRTLALGAAHVVENLAARITVAVTSGKGFGEFLQNAIPDLAKIGDSIGNLFGILGNLIHVMPGYANILLNFGDALLHIAEVVTKVGAGLFGAFLYIHGFIVWAGLGVTAAWALGKAFVFLGDTAIGKLIKGFIAAGIAAGGMTGEFSILTAVLGTFDAVWAAITAINPLIWVGAAVGLLIGLAVWFGRSETAAQKWGDALQHTIDSSRSVAAGLVALQTAQNLTTNNLTRQTEKLNATQEHLVITNRGTRFEAISTSKAWADQALATEQAREQAVRFTQEQQFQQGRMEGLTKAYHGRIQAMGLMNAAGITEQDFQKKGAEGWAILTTRMNSTIAGYKAMGQSGGTLNNDLSVMDRNITDQYNAMQKLNQAWDTFIGDVTGTQNNFDNVALGFKTLESNSAKASVSLGKARVASVGLGHSMDGLSKSDIALNQAFTTQVGQLNTLFDSWRTAGLSANFFTQGVKAGIEPLVKYAKGSKEGTAQLIALAQEAGYSGPLALKDLVKWLGNTHNSTQTLKKVTDQATSQEALLTGAMQKQGQYIASTLLHDIALAELAYSGVTTAAKNYGKAIAQYGQNSVEANAKQKTLTNTIIDAGIKTHSTVGQMAALITKLTGIPNNVAIRIVETGVGSFGITGAPGHELPHHRPGMNALGGRVTGGTPGKDSVLGWLMPGEVIVPTNMVNAGAVDHLRGHLPRFASGGWLEQGNKGVLTGQSAVNFNDKFINTFTSAMESAMTAAMKTAAAALAAARGGLGGGGGSVQRYAGVVLQVLSMLGQPRGDLGTVLSQMATESGGNPTIVNRSDSNWAAGTPSVGLMQVIGPTFASYAGRYRNVGPFEYGVSVDPFANIFAGLNYAIHRYGPGWTSVLGHGHGYATGTPGAAPGWAWVGERGPELVHMLGGERVIDAPTSSKITRGYAKGTEGSRGASLINIFRNDQSDKSWREDIRKYLRYINDYYNGRAKNWRDDMLIRQTKAMERAQDRLGNVNTEIKSYNKFRLAAMQGLSSYGDLSGIQLGPTAGTGDNVPLSGGAGIKSQLDAKLATLKQFSAALRKLTQMKLPASLLRQVVGLGPDAGLAMANELISGGPAFIKQLAGEEAAITAQEQAISRGVGAASVGAGYRTSHDFVAGLRRERRNLEDLFADLGKKLGQEAVRWFNVPKSKRPKGFASGGILTEPVWGIGASGAEYTFAENGPELISPKHLPRMGGGDTYIINVAGDSDPDGAARRIIQKVSDYKRRHGNASTGIG